MSDATLLIRVRFRLCRADDLSALEWFGLHGRDRDVIKRTFREQERGRAMMLLGDAGGFAIAQAWIDFSDRGSRERPHLWAVRVFPPLQGAGLGSRLLEEAERRMLALGAREAELAVECHNEAARRFYLRLGYRPSGPSGRYGRALAHTPPPSPYRVLRKELVTP